MMNSRIYKKALGLALAALTATACSDEWNDHYDVGVIGSDVSIWQAISEDENLSNFASVVKACGYDAALNSSQVFTVFAPTNETFSAEEAQQLIDSYKLQDGKVEREDNTVIKEFIQNHIALYNYSVAPEVIDTITMLNGKSLHLSTGNLSGSEIISSNKLQRNGVLFTLKDKIDYFPNVFEYLRKDADLDSVANFLYGYNIYEFDPSQSVPGEIKDGKVEYLDSVKILQNEMFRYLGRLSSEDSTYWMVAPTNEVWNSLVSEYEPYFNYADNVNKRDSLSYANTRLSMILGSVFSRTFNPDDQINDSVRSTQSVAYERRLARYGYNDIPYYVFNKPFEPGGVFYNTENHQCSNGQVMKTGEWNFDKRLTFFAKNQIEVSYRSYLDSIDSKSTRPLTVREVEPGNPFYDKVINNRYAEISSVTETGRPYAVFNVTNTLSNIGYDIYVVTAPALAGDTLATDIERLPSKMRFTLYYPDQTGKEVEERLKNGDENEFVNRVDAVDSILIARDFKFPTSTYYLGGFHTKLKIESRATSSEIRNNTYTNTMRINAIILKPHEEEN